MGVRYRFFSLNVRTSVQLAQYYTANTRLQFKENPFLAYCDFLFKFSERIRSNQR